MATKERIQNKFLKLKTKSKIKTKTTNISDPKLDKGFSYMTPISHEHKHTHTKPLKIINWMLILQIILSRK